MSSAVAARRRPATVVAKTRVARRFLQSSSRATRAMPRPLARRDALRRVKYGRSDMVVSELCAGSMTWGSFNGSEEEAHAQLDCFVEHGVNFFDTAEMYPVAFNYGKTTETWIGNWLTRRIDEGTVKREDLYFATKCNPLGTGGTVGKQGKWKKHAFDAGRLRASCEASLARLQCDYIDLYMLHFPSRMGGEAFGWANWKDGRYDAARTSTGAELCGNQPVRRVHFSAMTWPRWFRRAARNRHHHAIEQGSRRWRRGRRDDSARTLRKILISTQVPRPTSRRKSERSRGYLMQI